MCAYRLYSGGYTLVMMARVCGSVTVSAAAVLGFVLLLASSTDAVALGSHSDTIDIFDFKYSCLN